MESHFIHTAAVIGLGLMGGSFAARLTELGVRVIGWNRTKSACKEALERGIIASDREEDLREADIVIFSTPAEATLAFLRDRAALLSPKAVLTDIAGVKNGFTERLREVLPPGMTFVSGHPMCGREGAGLAQADPSIFDGANYLLIREENSGEGMEAVKRMAEALGCASVRVVTAEEHDRAVAYTSDLTHVIAASLMNSDSFTEETKYFTGGSFRDETRVADINGKLWTSLFLSNREKLLEEITRFEKAIGEIKGYIEKEDREGMTRFLEKAGERKRGITHGS